MKAYILIIIVCATLFGCVVLKKDFCNSTLSFQSEWEILLPCYKKKHLETEYHGEKHYIYYYENGAVFFVSDLYESPILISKYLNTKEKSSFTFYEKLSYEGMDENNDTYWKVIKENGLILGYINIHQERKSEFDKAILSIKQKE